MATDRLALYNIALFDLGDRKLDSLTEAREPRFLLDEVFTRGGGAIRAVLEQGLWNHAIRTVQIDKSASITPAFGYPNAFDMPTNFVRLVQISPGENFLGTLMRYEIEAGILYTDVDPIFMRFVSDSSDYGNDLSLWPETFTLWVGHWLGQQIMAKLLNDKDQEAYMKRGKRLLADARSKDAQQEPTRWPPLSSWASARLNRVGPRRDRGSRSQLTG